MLSNFDRQRCLTLHSIICKTVLPESGGQSGAYVIIGCLSCMTYVSFSLCIGNKSSVEFRLWSTNAYPSSTCFRTGCTGAQLQHRTKDTDRCNCVTTGVVYNLSPVMYCHSDHGLKLDTAYICILPPPVVRICSHVDTS